MGILPGCRSENESAAEALVDAMRTKTIAEYDRARSALLDGSPKDGSQSGQVTLRELAMAANNMLELGMEPEKAREMIRLVLSYQDKDPLSPVFGSFVWSVNPETYDRNSVEFIMLPIVRAVSGHSDKLGEEFLAEIRPSLEAALACIKMSNVAVEYTNIYLMRLTNLLLLGQHLGDEKAIELAELCLDNWLNYIGQFGVSEYSNPTYTSLSLYILETGHRYAESPELKENFERATRFLWTSIAANTFAPSPAGLAGSYSRNYNTLYGRGSILLDLYLHGIVDEMPTESFSLYSDTKAASNYLTKGFRPDKSILGLVGTCPRVVKEKFGPAVGQDRYSYITADYAIGSASYFYCYYDRQINVSLKSEKPLPQTTVETSAFHIPYGQKPPGFRKPFHLGNSIAAVQEKDLLLALLRVEPHMGNLKPEYLATNFIVPTMADAISIDGKPIEAGKAFSIPVNPDSIISIREGNSLVNFRFLLAEGVNGCQPLFYLDYDGNEAGAARFVARHYQGGPLEAIGPFYAALMLQTQTCQTDQDVSESIESFGKANIEVSNEADSLSARIALKGCVLEAALDKRSGKILSRKVNGEDYSPDVLSVNGVDHAKLCLGDYTNPRNQVPEPFAAKSTIEMANPGFEEGFKHWGQKYDPDSFFTVSPDASLVGSNGLRLNDLSEYQDAVLISRPIPCAYGREYELSFNYRLHESNSAQHGARVKVEVEFLDAEGRKIDVLKLKHPEFYKVELTRTGEGWHHATIRVSTLKDAVSMRVAIRSGKHAVSVADLDNFQFVEIEK